VERRLIKLCGGHRKTQFNFAELVAHDPNREHEEAIAAIEREAADESEPKQTVRIDFVGVESNNRFVISDTVEVNSSDPSPVQRLKYRRKGFYLFDKRRNQLNISLSNHIQYHAPCTCRWSRYVC
jgi:hypothetical protein